MRGCTCASAKRDPIAGARCRRGRRARPRCVFSSERKPSTARRPLVVPESARIASQACSTPLQRRPPVGDAAAHRAVLRAAARSTSSSAIQRGALDRRAQLLDQRAERRPASRRRAGSRARPRSASASSGPGSARTRPRASRAPRRAAGRSRPACRAAAAPRPGRGGRRGASRPARRSARRSARRCPSRSSPPRAAGPPG